MKVDLIRFGRFWYWRFGPGLSRVSSGLYSRRRDAVRGFERFCAAIKKGAK